jgi:hypothetical protein
MSLSPIIIILQKVGVEDDVLRITPNSFASGFDVEFKQNTIGNINRMYIEQSDIASYLCRFFLSLTMDESGCEHIQIDCPAYSTVIKSISTIQLYFPILRDQIQSLLLNDWPEEKKLSQMKFDSHNYYCEEHARHY